MLDFRTLFQATFWVPPLAYGLCFVLICIVYRKRFGLGDRYPRVLSLITFAVLISRFGYAIFLTTTQYFVWAGERIGSILINLPSAKALNTSFLSYQFNYFTVYVFDRFWLNLILALLLACFFVLFLRFLAHYRGRFFDTGEIELGGLLIFLSGWPNGLVFIALSFGVVVFLSIFRLIRQKGTLTTLGLPFIISAGIVFFWGGLVTDLAGLSALII